MRNRGKGTRPSDYNDGWPAWRGWLTRRRQWHRDAERSVRNVATWLQVLAMCMTAFVVIGGVLGGYSMVNILNLQGQLRQAHDEAATARNEVVATRDEVKEKAAIVRDAVETAVGELQVRTQGELADLRTATRTELSATQSETNAQLAMLQEQLAEITRQLEDIGTIFNRVAVEGTGILSPREQQLLVLLATKTDPESPAFALNRANLALQFGRYQEASDLFGQVLGTPGLDQSILERARALRAKADEYGSNPPMLAPPQPSGTFINGIDLVALPVATLNALVQRGYLTLQEAQEIVDSLPRQSR